MRSNNYLDFDLQSGDDLLQLISDRHELEKIEDYFPDILRRSLFVALWSIVEQGLNEKCDLARMQKNLQKGVRNLEGVKSRSTVIERAKKYLTREAGIQLPVREWGNLKDYQKLRNCLVHNAGHLSGCKDEKYLRTLISKQKFLSLTDDAVIIRKGFCEEVIRIANKFFKILHEAILM